MSWVRLFISPFGAIGQRSFVHGVIVITFVNMLMTTSALALHGPVGWPLLATLYPTACVTAKRLHTFTVSGWIQAPQRAAVAAALLTPLAPDSWWTAHSPLEFVVWGVALVAAAGDGAMYLYLALNPRQPPDRIGEIFG
ncbi:MAG: hypothetical protein WDM85_15795 [Caulobacteraceae bacterium]